MLKKWNNWFIVLIVQINIWYVVLNNEQLSIFWYTHFTIPYNHFISSYSSLIKFPLGEVFYLLIGTIAIYLIFRLIKKHNRSKQWNHLLVFTNFLLIFYNSCWGIVYHIDKLDVDTNELKVEDNELKTLYCKYLINAELIRNNIGNEYNETLKLSISNDELLKEFTKNSEKINEIKWIKNYNHIDNPQYKVSEFSTVMSYSGILGYYNPFTIESNINATNTDLKRIYTVYHELAHQMGFASENEANFIAFMIGENSNNLEIRYAIYFKTLISILNNISKTDPLFVQAQLENLPNRIKEDYDREIEYYKKYDGQFNEYFSDLNNLFLKANNQEGTISYSKYIILVNYYDKKRAE